MNLPKVTYLALIGLIFLGVGVFWLKSKGLAEEKIEVVKSQSIEKDISNIIKIDISGAINSSGVYDLPVGSRVEDALLKAGGLSTEADETWVATNLNRAAIVNDGQKIFIPAKSQTSTNNPVKTTNENISINSATQFELESLPQVGSATANKIIANRPYQSLEELVSKKVISKGTFDKIKDKISLW